jgi:L-histidine N-alpha-methyltransferase
MLGIGLDFSASLQLPAEPVRGPRTLFYPGSSIGNFTPAAALTFLRQAHAECHGGSLLIGVDLVKPVDILEPAYDDPLGVTAAFNRNLLLHLNRLAGTDFDSPTGATSPSSTAPSHASRCISKRCARQRCAGPAVNGASLPASACTPRTRTNGAVDDFAALLAAAGFSALRHWCDARGWFARLRRMREPVPLSTMAGR